MDSLNIFSKEKYGNEKISLNDVELGKCLTEAKNMKKKYKGKRAPNKKNKKKAKKIKKLKKK